MHIPGILSDRESYDWFSAELIRLIAKADLGNRERIRKGFPEHVSAFEDWYFGMGVWKGARKPEVRS